MQENQEQSDLLPPGRRIGTKSEYARHRGCAPSAITRAITDRRIPVLVIDGRAMIDFAQADAAWAVSSRPRSDSPGPSAPRGPRPDTEPADLDALAAARLSREQHAAELLGIRVCRARGELVARTDVQRDILDAAAIILGAWETLPDRLAPTMVGIDDQASIRAILRDEIEQLQQQISEQLESIINGRPKLDVDAVDSE